MTRGVYHWGGGPITWEEIRGFPGYKVNDFGQVLSTKRRKPIIMSPSTEGRAGYQRVGLYLDGKRIWLRVHSLVLEAWVRPRREGEVCRHLDGNPKNNCLFNLKYGTQAENMADKARHGRAPRGEDHPSAKLTEAQVRKIRRSYKIPGQSFRSLAKRFGVGKNAIDRIIKRTGWKHVPEEALS